MKLSVIVRIHQDMPGVPKLVYREQSRGLSEQALKQWIDTEVALIVQASIGRRSTVIGACTCFLPDGRPDELKKALRFLQAAASRHEWDVVPFQTRRQAGQLAGAYVWKKRSANYGHAR